MPGTNKREEFIDLASGDFKIAHISLTNRTDDHVRTFFGLIIEHNWEEN